MSAAPGPVIPDFTVISGRIVNQVLRGRETDLVDLVERTYRWHDAGESVNPPSFFLRFPDRPRSRIIALPASLGGEVAVDGLKWIASVPDNVGVGLPRASAVLVLNDQRTGYPLACLESSIISATRTAASAALAADHLSRGRERPRRIGYLGAGLIARYIHRFLVRTGWEFDEVGVFDVSPASAEGFEGAVERLGNTDRITVHHSPAQLIRSSDLVVFATVAATPHVHEVAWFDHHPLVLHVSLRDLAPEILLTAQNVVDDVDHCLKADTSAHLVEQRTGNRDFLSGTLADVIAGRVAIPVDRTRIFSPFGLGVLDLAVGKFVYDEVLRSGLGTVVPDFFHERSRYGQED
jgi:ornithine cyclodeaminase